MSRLDERDDGILEDEEGRELAVARGTGRVVERLGTRVLGDAVEERVMGRERVGERVVEGREAAREGKLRVLEVVTGRRVARELADRGLGARELVARGIVERELVGRELVGRELVGRELVERELVERELVERELVERELVERELVGRELGEREVEAREMGERELREEAPDRPVEPEEGRVVDLDEVRELLRLTAGRLDREAEEADVDRPDGGLASVVDVYTSNSRHRKSLDERNGETRPGDVFLRRNVN